MAAPAAGLPSAIDLSLTRSFESTCGAKALPPLARIPRSASTVEICRSETLSARYRAERSERELLDERRERMLLPAAELERVTKYEAHLHRLLERTLHELQRLQGFRLGQDVEVPRAVDVTVTINE